MKYLNFENNATYDCYINDDRGCELNLNECGYERCSPSHYWEGHKKFYLFHYILRGKGILRVNGGESRPAVQGQVFFVSPHDRIYYEADEQDPWEYIWIGFSGISAKSILQHSTLLKENVQDVKNEKRLLGLYRSILASSRRGDVAYLLVLSGLYSFIAYLLESYGIDRAGRDFTVKEQNFRKIVGMIDGRYTAPVGIAQIARAVGYEKTYVYRLFREYLSVSPQKYIQHRRIYEAMQRIKSGERESFEEIAASVGYNDYSAFYRVFRALAGMSPNEYRDRVKGNTIESLHLKEFDELEKKIDRFRGGFGAGPD